jgi:hypothetical protein
MKKLVSNYSFNAATKQITLSDYTSVDLESLLLITNVATNTIIYNFAGQGKGATVSGNVLTLDFDTTSMSNSDSLQIFIDNNEVGASESTAEALKDVADYLKILVNQTKTLATQDTAQRQRVVLENSSVTLVGNSQIVDSANQNPFSFGSNAFTRHFALADVWNTMELARINYQANIRSKLIF